MPRGPAACRLPASLPSVVATTSGFKLCNAPSAYVAGRIRMSGVLAMPLVGSRALLQEPSSDRHGVRGQLTGRVLGHLADRGR